ncbi:MAG: DinB family protein [Ignavibacteriales bacterium]
MFYKISDFRKEWEYESQATLKMMSNLTDASLAQPVVPEGRTLGFIAWHITVSLGEMLMRAGLKAEGPAEDAPMPESAAEIRGIYELAARSVLEQVSNNWNDATLLEVVDMYGEQWANGVTLDVLIRHQAHHRGQMSVLMRQAGLLVPGVYGPAKEEWAQWGMAPAK